MSKPFKRGNILIPKNVDMNKWSVVACDQYTSEPEYWNSVSKLVGTSPSTLKLTLPEIYLNDSDVSDRINKINDTMEEYLSNDIFTELNDSMIYVERTQSDGLVREGLIGVVDLEEYNYEKGSTSLIRATEKTVIERIPPRVKVRENALLELPHIMVLIDDEEKDIIESLKSEVTSEDILYDFELNMNGGHIRGYKLSESSIDNVESKLEKLMDKEYFENRYNDKDMGVLTFAMGDGNHSLATAKACYEKVKTELPEEEYLRHPARYALVELVNLHSPSLKFEAIHRVVFDTDVNDLLSKLKEYYNINTNGVGEKVRIITKDMDEVWFIENGKSNLSVGSIQAYLDDYLTSNNGTIDYIHGEDVTISLGSKENNIGFIFDSMEKNDLFKTVILDGALPRKTFSMGHANDKRYYLEARKIRLN